MNDTTIICMTAGFVMLMVCITDCVEVYLRKK